MKLKKDQLIKNVSYLVDLLDKITDPRITKVKGIYNDYDFIANYPINTKIERGGYEGSWVIYMLYMYKHLKLLKPLFESSLNAKIDDNSLYLVWLVHDLGRLGYKDNPMYLALNDNWKNKNGIFYQSNDKISYMNIIDRTMFILNQYEIKLNEEEYFTIKLINGMYDEDGNNKYLKSYTVVNDVRYDMPLLFQQAKMLTFKKMQNQYIVSTYGKDGIPTFSLDFSNENGRVTNSGTVTNEQELSNLFDE